MKSPLTFLFFIFQELLRESAGVSFSVMFFLKLKFWQVKVSYFLCYLRYAIESLDVVEGSFTSSFGNPFLNLTEIKREY